MKLVRARATDRWVDIGLAIVIVIPEQVSNHTNLACRMAGRFVTQVRRTNETRQSLHTDAVTK